MTNVVKILTLAVLLGSVGISGCKTMTAEDVGSDARRFTASELHRHLAGHTQIWWSGNGGAYYAEDGSFEAVWKGDHIEGTWTVSDAGVLCWHAEEWAEAGSSDNPCETYWFDGESIIVTSAGDKFPEHELRKGNFVANLM